MVDDSLEKVLADPEFFYKNLPVDPFLAERELLARMRFILPSDRADFRSSIEKYSHDAREKIVEGAIALSVWYETNGFSFELALRIPEPTAHPLDDLADIAHFIHTRWSTVYATTNARSRSQKLEALRSKYVSVFSKSFYEFEDCDIERIQTLMNRLRDLVTGSENFEEKHRRRILDRIEKLQAELNHRMSNLDRFWGLVGDAGVAVGKFGVNAKPFVDLIKEIAEIVWKVQAKEAELPEPEGLPQLSSPEVEGNEESQKPRTPET